MKKYKTLIISIALFLLFSLFAILVSFVDVQSIGPNASNVGFSTFNAWFHESIGVKLNWYKFTDYLSLFAIPVGTIFAIMGVVQWIKRKKILDVDPNILALGLFYILVFSSYLVFQIVIINYRPVLLESGELESSFPSSTTMLALTLFITAIDQICIYIKNKWLKISLISLDIVLATILIVGRIVSGVHWMTDIIGSVLLSSALIFAYFGIKIFFIKKDKKEA